MSMFLTGFFVGMASVGLLASIAHVTHAVESRESYSHKGAVKELLLSFVFLVIANAIYLTRVVS